MMSIKYILFHNKVGRFIIYFLIFEFFTNLYSKKPLELQISVDIFPMFFIIFYTSIPPLFRSILIWRKPSYIHEEFTKIARKINFNINNVIVKEHKKIFAYRNNFTNNIIISSQIIEKLTHEEVKGVLYHELMHKGKFYGLIKRVLIGIFFLPLMIFIIFLFWLIPSILIFILHIFIPNELIFITIIIYVFFLLFLENTTWKREYEADLEAVKKVGLQTYISALNKVVPKEKRNWNWYSHPSVEQRISYLKNKLNNS